MRKLNLNIKLIFLGILGMLLCVSALAQTNQPLEVKGSKGSISIYQTALEANEYDAFLSYLNLSGYDSLLKDSGGKYTLLLPSDAALAKLPKAYTDSLELNRDKLKFYVAQHIIKRPVTAAQLKRNSFQTIGGKVVSFQSFKLAAKDIKTKNGYIQVLAKAAQPSLPSAKPKTKPLKKRRPQMVALN